MLLRAWLSAISRSPILWTCALPVLALCLAHQLRSAPASPRTPTMDVEFNPERCAELHNKLLARTYESISDLSQHLQRNMIARVRAEIPEAATWLLEVADEDAESFAMEDLPFHRFFSRLDIYDPPERYLSDVPLSGEFKQPDPKWFYHRALEDDERHIILLYGDNVLPEPMDGGLFLNLDTWLVTWTRPQSGGDVPEDLEAWVPLELALRKGLEMWDRGKYYWDMDPSDRSSSLLLRPWTARDLDEAVQTWEKLLEAITRRAPLGISTTYQDPLPSDLVDEFQISPFAKAFLKAAKRPSFTYVAPGLTTFTNEAFRLLMGSEGPDAPRRREISRIGLEPDEWPSLLIPVASSIGSIPENPPPPGDGFFDKPWGYGRYTIARTAGLYTDFLRENADATLMVTAEGKTDRQPVGCGYPRPWGHHRSLTFAEMFDLWTHYVTEGIWEVAIDGIATPHSWFTDPDTRDTRRVYWGADSR